MQCNAAFATWSQERDFARKISVFSDGASSQFKQWFLFSNLHLWEAEFGVKLTWNLSATSHGKGVVDGIGGTVKRTVWHCA